MRSDHRTLRAAIYGAVVVTALLSLSPLFVGDLSWLGIEAWKYSDELSNAGSWMAGVGAVVLQVLALYLLYKTYHREKDEAARLRFESDLTEAIRQYENTVSMLRYDDSQGSYATTVNRQVHEGRPTFRIYLEILLTVHHRDGEEGLKRWFYEYDDYIGGWRRAVFAVVRHIMDQNVNQQEDVRGYLNSLRHRFSDNESAVLCLFLSVYPDRGDSPVARYLLESDFFHFSHLKERLREHYEEIYQAAVDKHVRSNISQAK